MTTIITLKLKTSAMKRTARKIVNEIMFSIKNIILLSAYPKFHVMPLCISCFLNFSIILRAIFDGVQPA
jgi:hypothetical protein